MEIQAQDTVSAESSTFAEDFERCMNGLRGVSIEALASAKVGIDSSAATIQKSLRLNRNLAWKLTRLVHCTDLYEACQHVPGQEGLGILVRAFAKTQASKESVENLRQAAADFERMIEVHVGDRKNLQLYTRTSMPEGVCGDQMESSRALGYQSNSATFGVQTRVDFSLGVLAPNCENPEFCDVGNVKGMLGFRRLRTTTSWPVLHGDFRKEGVELGRGLPEAIDDKDGGHEHMLLREYCSTPLPKTRAIQTSDRSLYEICEGPVGKRAETDCVFGSLRRASLPVFGRDGDETVGEHYFMAETPAERMQFDLLLHEDLPFPAPPRMVTCSKLHGEPSFPLSRDSSTRLPGIETLQDMGRNKLAIATPHIPRYGDLVEMVCERMGHKLEDFRVYRFGLTYPPIPLAFVAYHPLGTRVAGAEQGHRAGPH